MFAVWSNIISSSCSLLSWLPVFGFSISSCKSQVGKRKQVVRCLSSVQVGCWGGKSSQPLLSSRWSLFSVPVLILVCCPAVACGFSRVGQECPFPQNMQDLRGNGEIKEQVPFLEGIRLRTYYLVINRWPIWRNKTSLFFKLPFLLCFKVPLLLGLWIYFFCLSSSTAKNFFFLPDKLEKYWFLHSVIITEGCCSLLNCVAVTMSWYLWNNWFVSHSLQKLQWTRLECEQLVSFSCTILHYY